MIYIYIYLINDAHMFPLKPQLFHVSKQARLVRSWAKLRSVLLVN